MNKDDARNLAAFCRDRGIRLIPMFNCLGHQSWARNTAPLLKKYPQFDETPDVPADNKGIYCRSWCPLNPEVNTVVFALIDELIDAFAADAFHVGMDEVFLIASDQCKRCKGKDTAELFTRAVNDLHGHLVGHQEASDVDVGRPAARWQEHEIWKVGGQRKRHRACDRPRSQRHHHVRLALRAARALSFGRDLSGEGLPGLAVELEQSQGGVAFLEDARRVNQGLVIGHMGTTWVGLASFCKALLDPKAEVPKTKGRNPGPQGAAERYASA